MGSEGSRSRRVTTTSSEDSMTSPFRRRARKGQSRRQDSILDFDGTPYMLMYG